MFKWFLTGPNKPRIQDQAKIKSMYHSAREAAQKAREEAEAAALKNANDELAAKIEASKKEKQQREAAAASAAKKRKTTTGILAATFIGILAAVAIVIALSIKGPDYYAFDSKNKTFPVCRWTGRNWNW